MSSDNATQADHADPEAILTPPPSPEAPRNRRTVLISVLVIVALLVPALAGGVLWRVKNVPASLVVVHRANGWSVLVVQRDTHDRAVFAVCRLRRTEQPS